MIKNFSPPARRDDVRFRSDLTPDVDGVGPRIPNYPWAESMNWLAGAGPARGADSILRIETEREKGDEARSVQAAR